MTARQLSLFGINAYGGSDPPIARATDPPSSHRAAARVRANGRISGSTTIILAVLRRVQKKLTYRELWSARTDAEREQLREPSTICKRLPLMERRGMVRPGPERDCGAGGAPAREWELIEL